MKQALMLSLFLVVPVQSFIDSMRTLELMDQMFAEMSERVQAQKIEAPGYDVHIKKNGDKVEISLAVPDYVAAQHISVNTEDDALYVIIKAHGDRVELTVKDQMLHISAVKNIIREEKDDQGIVRVTSSGSSHMAQTIQLPAKIDLHNMKPTADLIDDILIITIGIKGSTKIPVTTVSRTLKSSCSEGDCNKSLHPEDIEIGCDVFKDTFEK